MPTFIILGNFLESGIKTLMLDEAADTDLATKIASDQNVNARIIDSWLTTGQRDVVVILDAPDVGAALSFAVAFGARARLTTETLAATDDIAGTVNNAREAYTRHEG